MILSQTRHCDKFEWRWNHEEIRSRRICVMDLGHCHNGECRVC